MSYRITIKPGHPTGSRRRNGQLFTSEPVDVESVTDEMRADPWLQIVEIAVPPLTDEERAAKEAAELEASARARQEEEGTRDSEAAEGDAGDPSPRRGRKR